MPNSNVILGVAGLEFDSSEIVCLIEVRPYGAQESIEPNALLKDKEAFFQDIDALVVHVFDIETTSLAITALNLFSRGHLNGVYVVASSDFFLTFTSYGSSAERFAINNGLKLGRLVSDVSLGKISSWLNTIAPRT